MFSALIINFNKLTHSTSTPFWLQHFKKIAWKGDRQTDNRRTSQLLDWISPVGRFGENLSFVTSGNGVLSLPETWKFFQNVKFWLNMRCFDQFHSLLVMAWQQTPEHPFQILGSESRTCIKLHFSSKLDGVGLVDNRPSTDKLHHFDKISAPYLLPFVIYDIMKIWRKNMTRWIN